MNPALTLGLILQVLHPTTGVELPHGHVELAPEEQERLIRLIEGVSRTKSKYAKCTIRATAQRYKFSDEWQGPGHPVDLVHIITTTATYRSLDEWKVRTEGQTIGHIDATENRTGLMLRDGEDYWSLRQNPDTSAWFVTDAGQRSTEEPDWRLGNLTWYAQAAWRGRTDYVDPLAARDRYTVVAVTDDINSRGEPVVEVRFEVEPLYEVADPLTPEHDVVYRYRQHEDMYLLESFENYGQATSDEPDEYRTLQRHEYNGTELTRVVREKSVRHLPSTEFTVYRKSDIVIDDIDFQPPKASELSIHSLIDTTSRSGIAQRPTADRSWLILVNVAGVILLVILLWWRSIVARKSAQ